MKTKRMRILSLLLVTVMLVGTVFSSAYADMSPATSGANDWQIVAEQYAGNAAANKTVFNNEVRIQKNVVPTDKENEFMVYMAVDAKYEKVETTKTITEKLSSPKLYVCTNANQADLKPGYIAKPNNWNSIEDNKKKVAGSFTINYYYDGLLIANPTLSTIVPNSNIMIMVGDKFINLLNTAGENALQSEYDVHLQKDAYELLFENLIHDESDTKTESVVNFSKGVTITDPMGAFISFEDGATGDFSDKTVNGNEVTWTLEPKDSPTLEFLSEEGPTETTIIEDGKEIKTTVIKTVYWGINVVEIQYKIRLDVEKDGFENGTHYNTNGPTVLHYGDNKTVEFQQPKVRGTLYQFSFTKVDDKGNKLAAPQFTLSKKENGKIYTGENNSGEWTFSNLPIGTYTLTENVPEGYTADKTSWQVDIEGYTEDPGNYSKPAETANAPDCVWKGNAEWKIVNKLLTFNLTVTKKVTGGLGDVNKPFGFNVSGDNNFASQTFELKNGESKEITVPYGTNITVAESDNSGYITTYQVNEENPVKDVSSVSKEIKADCTVLVTNDKEANPPTGISLDSLPYILILAVAGVAVVALILVKLQRKRNEF